MTLLWHKRTLFVLQCQRELLCPKEIFSILQTPYDHGFLSLGKSIQPKSRAKYIHSSNQITSNTSVVQMVYMYFATLQNQGYQVMFRKRLGSLGGVFFLAFTIGTLHRPIHLHHKRPEALHHSQSQKVNYHTMQKRSLEQDQLYCEIILYEVWEIAFNTCKKSLRKTKKYFSAIVFNWHIRKDSENYFEEDLIIF